MCQDKPSGRGPGQSAVDQRVARDLRGLIDGVPPVRPDEAVERSRRKRIPGAWFRRLILAPTGSN